MISTTIICFLFLMCNVEVQGFKNVCNKTQYYEPSQMICQMCAVNTSMVATADGFSCECDENSVPAGVSACRRCKATEMVSADRSTCIPRKCHSSAGRHVCRKCPADYVSVTHNLDGSPSKEVTCVMCARGYKAQNNVCVRCASCACARNETALRGICVQKSYLGTRPKYEGKMHADTLLEVIKQEYLCTKGDVLACRALANECVRQFYSTDVAGPCRLWLLSNEAIPKGLPELVIAPNANEMNPTEFILPKGQNSLLFLSAVYKADGKFQLLNTTEKKNHKCFFPIGIDIGNELLVNCDLNMADLEDLDRNSTFAVLLNINGILKPLPVTIRKPDEYYVKRGTWSSGNFRRYFLWNGFKESTNNRTVFVYIRTLLVRIQLERDRYLSSSLRVRIQVEAQYVIKSSWREIVTSTLKVEFDMPKAGLLRSLEIWGGVLGALLSLYALVQWRGEMRRGGMHFSLLPLLAGSVSDALYFAVWFSAIHALVAQTGVRGQALPLSKSEEHVVRALVYSTVCLKAVKVACLNWKQCTRDIFFLDWLEYNSSFKETPTVEDRGDWRAATLAREWSRLQTLRRAPPAYTTILTLILLQLINFWQSHIYRSPGYKWALATCAWWGSYLAVLACRGGLDRLVGPPPALVPKICQAVGISLLVFQEERYVHYVHGRNDENKDHRLMSAPLAMCRVVMAPPLRIVYNRLSSFDSNDLDATAKQGLLTRLLAAFFERALDGLSWVASERTVLERLLDVELADRESGTTSVLLYDPQERTPSCVAVTWWGEEWSLGTFDGMVFGSVIIATNDPLLAALITLVLWKIMQRLRLWFRQSRETNGTYNCLRRNFINN